MKSGISTFDVSIIVPTLNEAENIDALLSAIFESVGGQAFKSEVIVVDDGSKDGTRDRVRRWSAHSPVRLVEREHERGLTGAVLAGAHAARSGVVVVMDADLSHPASVLPQLIQPVLGDRCDMVIGTRYMRGGKTVGWPLKRKLISRAASLMAWPLVDVADPMSGYFAVRRERMLAVDPDARGFKIGMELLVNTPNPPRVEQVPIVFREREAGRSKLGASTVFAYLDRLRVLAGGRVSGSSAVRFGVVGLMGVAVDSLCFWVLMLAGVQLALAHLLSFAAATLFNFVLNARWSFRPSAAETSLQTLWRMSRYILVILMALCLRGAVLGTLIDQFAVQALPAVVIAIIFAAVVSYLGYAFFVFPDSSDKTGTHIRWRVACVGVVGYLVLIRFFNLGLTELLREEAYYWNYAKHPSPGYLDHPPMVAWLIGLGTWVFGDTEFGVRIGAFTCWAVTAFFGYAMTKEMFDKAAAMRTVLLLAIMPFFFSIGFLITPDAPLTMCWAGTLYFLQRVLLGGRDRAWWGVGLFIGLGMLSKYSIGTLGPAILLYLAIDPRARRWFLSIRPYLAVVLAVAFFSPVIYWNWKNDWASFAFQTVNRINAKTSFGLPQLVGSCLLLLTPLGLIAGLRAFAGGPSWRNRVTDDRVWGMSRTQLFAIVFAGVPLLVFVVFSLTHQPKLNWTGPAWLALIPLVAARMVPDASAVRAAVLFRREQAWALTTAVLVLGYSTFLYYTSIGLPGVPYPSHFVFAGWRDMGEQIERIEERVEAQRRAEPLVVGLDTYGISSRIAFYRFRDDLSSTEAHAQEGVTGTSGRHAFDQDSLMFSVWNPTEQMAGRDIIIVDFDDKQLMDGTLEGYFDSMSQLCRMPVQSHGRSAGEFYYRIGYDYHPSAGAFAYSTPHLVKVGY